MLFWPSLFHVEQALSVTGFKGHPAPGEDFEEAVVRICFPKEELRIRGGQARSP